MDGPKTLRRLRHAAFASLVLMGWHAIPAPAVAIEVQCIEASRYKYLYQLFDNDRQRLAAYLKIDAKRLPDGEICRAVIVSGPISARPKAKTSQLDSDSARLLRAIEQNGGWLATLYLLSSGGNVRMGMELAQLTRMFWLKTVSLNERDFPYYPDFGLVHLERPRVPPKRVAKSDKAETEAPKRVDRLSDMPPPEPIEELAAGWSTYQKVAPYRVKGPQKAGRCASACTFMHVAGIDRSGVAYVHRPRFSAKKTETDKRERLDTDLTMTQTLEGLQRSEAGIVALYQQMDAGGPIIRLFESTTTATVQPSLTERFPRYVSDYLNAKCGGDAVALERREANVRAALGKQPADKARIEKVLSQTRSKRGSVESCVAGSHEAERLAQFAKHCPGGTCNGKAIETFVENRVKALRERK